MRFCAPTLLLAVACLASLAPARAEAPPDAHWMWFDEGDPDVKAREGKVWFRRQVRASEPSTGAVQIAADDRFVLWVNGRRIGEAGSLPADASDPGQATKSFRFNLNGVVERGPNVIAIEASNRSGAAGLLIEGEIRGQGGGSIPIDSPTGWLATREEPAGDWLQAGFEAAGWTPVRDLGPHGDSPWKSIQFSESYLDRFQVPDGFALERVAEPELVGSLVAITWGNRGRLLASREGGPIQVVIDENGDGIYDKAVEYSGDIQNCQGLCMLADDLYAVGNGPQGTGLYRLPDRDHDDVADSIEVVALHRGGMGEHGPHSVVLAPDGRLYHNLGNHAWITAEPQPASPVHKPYEGDLLVPRFEDGNGHAAGIKVPGGTIWRFSPDGGKWWLETAGFRNEYDIAFNSLGELYTFDSDMEWDVAQPWYRPVRINHCIPGAEFGWRSGTAKWPAYYFDSLPGTVDVGRGSPTGVVFYEHHQFPEKYSGCLLACDWSMGRILAVHLEPRGASFGGRFETLVSGNPLNVSDIEVDRDGSIVFSTGGRNTEGGVYRVSYVAAERKTTGPLEPRTLDELIALGQPQSAWARQAAARVKDELGDEWQRGLEEIARREKPAEQLRALSLLAQLGPRPEQQLLLELAADDDADVRAFVAWLIADYPDNETAAVLARLLGDEHSRVRRRACEAFVRSGLAAPIEPLLELLAGDDRWLRFAARLALLRVPANEWRQKVLAAGSPRLRIEGLLALNHAGSEAFDAEEALVHCLALLRDPSVAGELRLDVLRMIQLGLLAGAKKESEPAVGIGQLLLAGFPTGQIPFDMESARVLAVLQIPGAAGAMIDEIERCGDQSLQLHYVLCLRFLDAGWDFELKARLLDWYETTQSWEGGHSLRANIDNIVGAALGRFDPQERRRLIDDWQQRPHAAKLLLRSSKPEQVHGFETVVARMMVNVDRNPGASAETVDVAIEALGQSGSPAALELLRKLYDDHPDRREQLARMLAQHPHAESRPQLLRSLQFGDTTTIQLCLRALLELGGPPGDAEAIRSVILAGLKLGDRGGLAAVQLLEDWTGSPHGASLDAKAALIHYQRWFHDTYPDAPPAELPQSNANNTGYTYEQLLELLEESEQGRMGDAKRGEEIFGKANCLKCHRFESKGEGIGPDLTALRRRFQRKEIVESLVYPSQVVSDQYRSVTVATIEGQVFTGMPATQEGSDKVVLLLPDATRLAIARHEIDEMQPATTSVMPEGLLKDLSPQEIVDLFAFLETSKDHEVPHDGAALGK